jgi:4-diphosphocytidyl-2-C-methyl-D-erythritol kinase
MICFPNIKINIGLDILSKREDNYHNIETVFYPVNGFNDILEIIPAKNFELVNKGIQIDCSVEKNLCYKAFKIIEEKHKIDAVRIILYKNVPFGTGLGSGSSDAAHSLILLNDLFELNLSEKILVEYASQIGADCAFFIKNKPVLGSGIGNIFSEIDLSLKGMSLVICLPEVSVNTANAYQNCKPTNPKISLSDLIRLPVNQWAKTIKNDFEDTIFPQFPVLGDIKAELYENGAIYAQMSGSGSAVFGLFEKNPDICLKSCGKHKIIKL